ncbi:MAG TPA: redoxin family protein [Phycisphaerae bacterium]|nr:redoxin family protein [Phycisphaerae bacterium]
MQRFNCLLVSMTAAAFVAMLSLGTAVLAQEKEKPAKDTESKAGTAEGKTKADEAKSEVTLSVGDPAPAMKVEKFIKGAPVEKFKPGQVYVVEFWSTWCGPCKTAMPHLTELQKKFKDKATFISVNVWEDNEYNDETLNKVEKFIKKNDENMGYTVAFDGAKKETDKAYMKAAGQNGIPTAFVVTGDSKIAYIGHPEDKEFEATIQQLVDNKFDMKAAIAAAKERKAKEEAFMRDQKKAMKLMQEAQELIEDDKLDEGLAKMDEIVKLNADFAPMVEMQKFTLLMDQEQYDKAYQVAKKLIEGPAGDSADTLNAIAWAIVDPEADVGQRDVNVALKAAEKAVKLTESKSAAILDTLARCYWLKGDKAKAVELQTRAVELAKKDEGLPDEAKEGIKAALDEYKSDAKAEKKEGKPAKEKKEKEADEEEDD